MSQKHYQQELSAFVNSELPPDARQVIAEHILQCELCREEHDSIRMAAALAGSLRPADAPARTWKGIQTAVAGSGRRDKAFWGFPGWAVAGLIVGLGLLAVVYFAAFRNRNAEVAVRPSAPVAKPAEMPAAPPRESPAPAPEIAAAPEPGATLPGPNLETSPERAPAGPRGPIGPPSPRGSWTVETIAGNPKIGNAAEPGKLVVGELLVTDSLSRASLEVADIGRVEVAPNSRVRLVNTSATEHRLSLERGQLHAKILAPPRLFIVDTPSAVAVDLGCEYTLEVDAGGNSKLHVTGGYVALERDGRESIVPAGAFCLTRKGQGIGTPYFEGATLAFEAALNKFDFQGGGAASLTVILADAGAEDTLTLWHLLPRVTAAERERIFAVAISYVALPTGVTREGIMRLDKKMLESWRLAMETIWFGSS